MGHKEIRITLTIVIALNDYSLLLRKIRLGRDLGRPRLGSNIGTQNWNQNLKKNKNRKKSKSNDFEKNWKKTNIEIFFLFSHSPG